MFYQGLEPAEQAPPRKPDREVPPTRFIGVCGLKQSGKSSFTKSFVAGLNAAVKEDPVLREFFSYREPAQQRSFARPLKDLLVACGYLTPRQVMGSEKDKASKSRVRYCDIQALGNPSQDYMTAREVMQYFGTEVVRAGWERFWIDVPFLKVEQEASMQEQPLFVVLDDTRFADEAIRILHAGGIVITVERYGARSNSDNDTHPTEKLAAAEFEHLRVYNDGDLADLQSIAYTLGITIANGNMPDGVQWATDHRPRLSPNQMPTIAVPAEGGV